MKRLPAPFPFFNQSKRPKQSSSSTTANYHTNLQPMVEQTNKPNHKPIGASHQYQTSNSVQYYDHTDPSNWQSPNATYYQQQMLPQSTVGNITKPHTNLLHTSQQRGLNSRQPLRQIGNVSLSQTIIVKQSTTHQEPRQVHSSQILSRSRNQTRVITTSSQGVQYWSQYRYNCHLLFEIYGLLDSQVSSGQFGCLQFMLKTVDGVIKCQFWEIDNQLNRLYRGKSYRVIGTWDNCNKVLKCAKVRESTSQEQTHSNLLVKISDTAMREFTSSIPEP